MTTGTYGSWSDEVFAERLRTLRTLAGVNQDEAGQRMAALGFDFHKTTVGKIERSQRRVSIGEAMALAQIIGRPIEEFLSTDADNTTTVARAISIAEALNAEVSAWSAAAEDIEHRAADLDEALDALSDEAANLVHETLGKQSSSWNHLWLTAKWIRSQRR